MTKTLLRYIQNHITACEQSQNHKLNSTDRQILVEFLFDCIEHGVPKFIAGAKEHGGFLLERDLKKELRNEHFDAGIYAKALEFKLRSL